MEFGRFKLKAISTLGQTDACTSFYTEGRLFTGNSLLICGCGRTDLQQGDPEKLFIRLLRNYTRIPTLASSIWDMIILAEQLPVSGKKNLLTPEYAVDKS